MYLILWENDNRKLSYFRTSINRLDNVIREYDERARRLAVIHNGQILYRGGYAHITIMEI